MRVSAGLLAFVFVLSAAGCGKATQPPGSGPDSPDASAFVDLDCPKEHTPGLDPGGVPVARSELPADFVTAWVHRCRAESRAKPREGTVIMQIVERADAPATELIEQLRRPSDPRTNQPCTLEMVAPPYFLLVDATGRAILPAIPTDPCGKPRPEATRALDAMTFHIVSETQIGQAQSQLSIDTGCSDSWKDMVTIEADRAQPAPATPLWSTPDDTLRVCLYDLTGTQTSPAGTLRAGRVVDGTVAAALVAALDRTGAATACSAPHTRFAVVSGPSGAEAVAELDGCRRLLRPDTTLGQLDEATVVAITG